ncbi:hypothetical protein CVT26_005807 [Gymnopilus dilepis]|uniref:Uncharacterized protein n=1 Tax=Gymnopilus dilepis TaxID=231916 RepID=A0A409WG19_9AGAR|nr:hypothetical protein CVT26_005807 [Gymnopilus dilepis]
MAVQSAYRAIARRSSGCYVSLPRPCSDFSGDNWGDSEMRDASKAPKTLPPYTIQGPTPTKDSERVVGKKRPRSSSGDDATTADATAKAEVVECDFEIEDDAEAQDAMDMAEDSKETAVSA